MKKATKALIVTASVAAVVGIGAVSFAKWQGGNTKTSVSGSTDSISLLGFDTAQTATLSDKLQPFDQDTGADATTVTLADGLYRSVELKVKDDGKTYNVKAAYDATVTTGSWHGDIYCKVAAAAPTDVIDLSTDGGVASLGTKGWVKLNKGASAETVEVDGANTWSTTAPTAYFLLVSSNTEDMNATVTVTLELAEVTSSS